MNPVVNQTKFDGQASVLIAASDCDKPVILTIPQRAYTLLDTPEVVYIIFDDVPISVFKAEAEEYRKACEADAKLKRDIEAATRRGHHFRRTELIEAYNQTRRRKGRNDGDSV